MTTSPRLSWPDLHSFGNAAIGRAAVAVGPSERDPERAAIAVRLDGLSGLALTNLTITDPAVAEALARALLQAAVVIREYDGEVPDPVTAPTNLTILTAPEKVPCPDTHRQTHTYCTTCMGRRYVTPDGAPWAPVVHNPEGADSVRPSADVPCFACSRPTNNLPDANGRRLCSACGLAAGRQG